MRYFGGKFRVRKQIAEVINQFNPKTYLEPFCGSCWVGELVKADLRICTDLNSDLIAMWQAAQSGWIPPDDVTQEEYQEIKKLPSPNPLRGFVGFGCSYAGKFFGGYARGGHGADAATAKSQLKRRLYAGNAKSQLKRRLYAGNAKSQGLSNVIFENSDYKTAITASNADVVYCDPPYKGTTKFYGVPDFDHQEFWQFIREQAKLRTIFISEYTAPPDFIEVLTIQTKTDIRSAEGKLIPRVEKLFMYV